MGSTTGIICARCVPARRTGQSTRRNKQRRLISQPPFDYGFGVGVLVGVCEAAGVFVEVGVFETTSVFEGTGVFDGTNVFVGMGVFEGIDVFVGVTFFVGVRVGGGVLLGVAVASLDKRSFASARISFVMALSGRSNKRVHCSAASSISSRSS